MAELDEYLTVLAVHKGTLAAPDASSDFGGKKVTLHAET